MRRVLSIACLFLALVSCGEDESGTGDAPSVITGTVVEVESQGLTDVNSFVVSRDDQHYRIYIDERTKLDFPPTHLNEHRISGDPVRVEIDKSNAKLIATQIGDG